VTGPHLTWSNAVTTGSALLTTGPERVTLTPL
jgi:hypothetical protein